MGILPNLSFNGLKQSKMEIEEGSACVLWYEIQIRIGWNHIFHQLLMQGEETSRDWLISTCFNKTFWKVAVSLAEYESFFCYLFFHWSMPKEEKLNQILQSLIDQNLAKKKNYQLMKAKEV